MDDSEKTTEELDRDENELENKKTSFDDFEDSYVWDTSTSSYVKINEESIAEKAAMQKVFEDIEPNEDVVALTTDRERRLLDTRAIVKKTIRVSLKSFLISLSLTFLNIFI